MKKFTLLIALLLTFVWQGQAQFGCGSGVVISDGYTADEITTPGTGGAEDWNDNPEETSISGYYWDDDVYLFQYTAGSTAENISMTIFTRNSWNGIGIFEDCTGTIFSNELDATGSSLSSITQTVTANIAAGSTVYIAVGQWGTPNGLDFDVTDFSVTPILCPEPSELTASNISTTTADLSWTAGADETLWNIEIVEAGETPTGVATETGVSNPYTATDLNSSASYEFYVQADCGEGDVSEWAGPYAFSTNCELISSFPWNENFEGATTPDLANCWQEIDNNGDGDAWQTYTEYGVGDSQSVGIYTDYNSGDNDDYLILPQFDLTGNERLKFSVRVRSDIEPDEYEVLLSTTGTDPSDFGTVLMAPTTISNETPQEISPIDLSDYTGEVYIAIHIPNSDTDGWYIYFDDFVVEEIPACPEPQDLMASEITENSVDLEWSAGGDETLWNIEVVEVGETPTGTATETGVTNPHTLTDLDSNTTYEFYVQADCGLDDLSEWAGPFEFTTACGSFGDFTENFDDTSTNEIPQCWYSNIVSTTGSPYVYVSTSSDYSAPNGLRMGNSADANAELYFISPVLEDLPNQTHQVKFFASGNGDLEVGTMSDPTDESTYTVVEVLDITSDFEEYTVNFDEATTDNHIVFKGTYTSTYYTVSIDDIIWQAIPSCPEPSDLVATNITTNSADLAWTAGGDETTWNIELVAEGAEPTGNPTISGITNPYTVTELNLITNNYEIYIQADCGEDDLSAWAGPYNLSGYCNSEPSSVDNDGITSIEIGGANYTPTGEDVTYHSFLDTPVNVQQGAEASIDITFATSYTYNFNIWIDYNDNLEFESSELVFSGESSSENPTTSNGTFTIPEDAQTGTHRMRIGAADNGQATPNACYSGYYGVTVDLAINILSDEVCMSPTNLAVSNIFDTSATVNWSAGGNEEVWSVIYGEEGFDPETEGTTIEGAESGEIISSLSPETEYEFYVIADCGTGVSDLAGPFSFSTTESSDCGHEQISNNFDNGLFMESGGQLIANDFMVNSNTTNFSLEGITVNLLTEGGIDTMDIIFLEDDEGMPGDEIETVTDVEPTSQDIIGTAFGFDVHEVVLDLDTPIDFAGDGENDVTYWVQLVGHPVVSGTQIAWEVTEASTIGELAVYDNDGIEGAIWNVSTAGDGVFELSGECTLVNCPFPSNLMVTNLTTDSVSVGWNSVESAVEFEYILIFEGLDPETATPVETGTTTDTQVTIDELSMDTGYEFYIYSSCADEEESAWTSVSFYTGYCESVPSSNDGNGIANIEVGTTDFVSGGDITYEDFTETPVDLAQAIEANVQITFETGYTYDTNIWIDFNDNLEFESSELVFSGMSESTNPTTLDASFMMPVDAPLGVHRMRIGTADAGQSTPDPCYNGFYGVTADLTVNILEAPNCLVPTDLSVVELTADTATIGWEAFEDAIEYDYILIFEGLDPETATPIESGTTTDTEITLSDLDADTAYELYVLSSCADNEESFWTSIPFFTGYCESVPSSNDGNGIEMVEIGTTDFLSGGDIMYEDFTDTTVDLAQALESNITVTFDHTFMHDTNIWIDFNNDLVFDESELVFAGESPGSTPNEIDASFMMPADAPLGTHRMRIGTAYSGQATPDPCFNGSWGVTADFTINIVEAPDCLAPTNLSVVELNMNSGTFGWDEFEDAVEYDYILIFEGLDPEIATPIESGTTTDTEITLSDLDADTAYELYVLSSCADDEESFWTSISFFTGYCDSVPTSNDGSGITSVEVGTTTFASEGDLTYEDFTDTPVDLPQGLQANVEVLYGHTLTYGTNVWIDFNNDLVFDESELVFAGESPGGTPNEINTSFMMPVDASLGTHRMRIATADFNQSEPDPCYNGTWGVTADFTVNITEAPDCLPVNNVVLTDLTSNSVTATWDEVDGAIEYNWIVIFEGMDPETATPIQSGTTTDTTEDITGLGDATNYDFYVMANCDADGDSPWSVGVSFLTFCDPVSEFSEDFDDVSTPNIPVCWDKVLDNGVNSFARVETVTANNYSAPNGVEMYNSGSPATSNMMLVSPMLTNLDEGTHWLRFYARNTSETQDVEVGTISDPNDGSTFTSLETVDINSEWTQYTVEFESYSGTDQFIAIRRLSTSTYTYVYLDNIIWEERPDCIWPEDVVASNTTLDGVSVAWEEVENATSYDWVVVLQGGDPDEPTDIITSGSSATTEIDIDELDSGTEYEVYVQADCDTGSMSPWSEAAPFTTAYGCGDMFYDTGGADGNYSNSEVQTWTFYPNDPTEYVQITFTMVNVETCCDELMVYDGTDTTAPLLNGDIESPGVYTSSSPGGALTVVFTPDSSITYSGWEAMIDCVTCIAPTNIQIDEAFADGAMVSWDALEDAIDGYTWVVVAAGGDPTDESEILASGTTIDNMVVIEDEAIVSGLDYEVFVMSNCGEENGMSGFSQGHLFTTLCQAPTGLAVTETGAEEVTFSWDPVEGSLGYEYVIVESGMDPIEENYVGVGTIGSGSQSSITIGYLIEGVDYDLYLRIVCDTNYYGEWSSVPFTTIGVKGDVIEGFSYYPNPVQNVLYLEARNNIDTVVVYNLLGQEVIRETPNALNTQVEMSQLQAGAYIVRVTVEGQTGTYRILKE